MTLIMKNDKSNCGDNGTLTCNQGAVPVAPQDVSWWVSSQALAGQLHLSFTVSVVVDIKLITIFIMLIDVLFITSTNLNQHPTHPG